MVVDCDLAKVEFSRTHWPFLRDRRIDAYGAADQAVQRLTAWRRCTEAHRHARRARATRFRPSGIRIAHLDQLAAPEGISFPGRYHEAIEDIVEA